ncbi:hypothetical protein IU449_11945 [Nocardia higoensis]|uniref:Uncharacterized protein n=1 Tax=Nocardia higoensis TaxID=228599 RepID=A0ABS0D9X7_9NOCA|nr:hypothetical protein [Nocardia higoensis]MBF6355245.1 hypothetical protein [Nocardia higoensis]
MAVFRRFQGDSLWQGWWSASSLIVNPIVLLGNLIERDKVRGLSAPNSGSGHLPMDPGKPLTSRPQVFGLLVPMLGLGLVVILALTAGAEADDRPSAYPPT